MVIVSDTSPVTNLIQLGKIGLLHKLFGDVVIPRKVYLELIEYENHERILVEQDWIKVAEVENVAKVDELENSLDSGESEAIVLAEELKADFLLIDELKGRNIAESRGLRITGLLGILIQAKRKGFQESLKPDLDKLVDEIGFRVHKKLYNWILKQVGE